MKLKTTIALSLAAIAFAGVISGCGGDKKPAASSAAVKNEISVGITLAILNRSWNMQPRKLLSRV